MSVVYDSWRELAERLGGRVLFDQDLSSITTMGVGGRAFVYAEVENIEELRLVLANCLKTKTAYLAVGAGSNIIFGDAGFNGMIIKLGESFRYIKETAEGYIKVGAATMAPSLIKWAVARSLAGVEVLAGIPCTVGGAVAVNAGTGGAIGDIVEWVHYLTPNGEERKINRQNLSFTYRSLKGLDQGAIITDVELNLEPSDKNILESKIQQSSDKRWQSQPKGRSAGCIFKNPQSYSAGKLIDECGLKGLKIGGAKISEIHANFIVNMGQAKCEDIKQLIKIAQQTVWEKRGIKLETEVQIIECLSEKHVFWR